MAKAKEKPEAGEQDAAADRGRKGRAQPFLWGVLLGLAFGVAVGWWIRPPESFHVDELRDATEKKFLRAQDQSRDKLADFAESLARKLREKAEPVR